MRGADYVIKRTAFAAITVFVAITINFALFRLAPGNAVSNLARVPHATPELHQELKRQFGLDRSKGAQYVIYLKQLVRGNLGVSFENQQPVSHNIWVALIDPDFMLSVVTCAQYGGWSDSAFCDKKYDRMYSQQQLTPDQGKRRAIVWQMQKYLYDRRPYIWLAAQDSVDALSSKWTGLVPSPQGPFNSLSKASLTSVHQK